MIYRVYNKVITFAMSRVDSEEWEKVITRYEFVIIHNINIDKNMEIN